MGLFFVFYVIWNIMRKNINNLWKMKNYLVILISLILVSCSPFWWKNDEELELKLEKQKEIVELKLDTLNEIKKDIEEEKEEEICIAPEDTKIYAYMYHYIRKNIDSPRETFYNNVTVIKDFEDQMKEVAKLENEWKLKTIFASELDGFATEWCYPNKNIVLLFSDDGWDDTYKNLFPIVKENKVKFNIWIIAWNTKEEERYFNFMTKSEVKEMSDNEFIEIVSHSFEHNDLRFIWDWLLEKEVCQSKKAFEEMWIKTDTFIYPAWKYDNDVIKMLRDCGYKNAYTTVNWINNAVDYEDDKYELKRIRVLRNSSVNSLFNYFNKVEEWE